MCKDENDICKTEPVCEEREAQEEQQRIEGGDEYEWEFQPDLGLKKLFMELSSPTLLQIINGLFGTDLPLDGIVTYENTEHSRAVGGEGKTSVRGDLLLSVHWEHDETDEQDGRKVLDGAERVMIEFQSTPDSTMGHRMFLYGMNYSQRVQGTGRYRFPHGMVLYTTLDKPETGMDQVEYVLDHFSVGKVDYSYGEGDILTVKYPFLNLLKKDYFSYTGTEIEPLKAIYLYLFRRYPQKIRKMEFEKIVSDLVDYVMSYQGEDGRVLQNMMANQLVDLVFACGKAGLKEEWDFMTSVKKTSFEIAVEESWLKGMLEGELKGKLEGKREGKREGMLEGKLEGKLEVLKGFLGNFSDEDIARCANMPLEMVKKLRLEGT